MTVVHGITLGREHASRAALPAALAACGPLARCAGSLHASWESYARAFLAGEATAGHPDDVRHIVFAQVVARLLADDRSPWREVCWLDAGAA